VSHLTLAACEEIHLALPAAPFAAGVEVQQTQRGRGRHLRRMSCPAGSRNASWWLEPQPSGPNVARVVPSQLVLALALDECRAGQIDEHRTTRTIPSSEGKGVHTAAR